MWLFPRKLLVALCLLGGLAGSSAQAQQPSSVGFRNDLQMTVLVQGACQVNGMLKRGQPLLVPPGKIAFDLGLPAGPRVYSVYDANQSQRVLVRDQAVNVLPGRDLYLVVRVGPGGRVVLSEGN